MISGFRKLTIVKLKKIDEVKDVNKALQWLSMSLGLFSLRDKKSSCYRIFIELIKAAKQKRALTSDEIAYKTGLSRGAVVHHLRRLIVLGIIEHRSNKYMLSDASLKDVIRKLREEANSLLEEIENVAGRIDRML